MDEETLNAIKARSEAASEEVRALCNGKRWQMTIPARRNEDSDLIIADALRDVDALLAEIERLRGIELKAREYKALFESPNTPIEVHQARRALFDAVGEEH